VRSVWIAPVAVFVALAGVDFYVARRQIDLQRSLLERHTADVAVHASRSLSLSIDARLAAAEGFAQGWSTGSTREIPEARLGDLGRLLSSWGSGVPAVGLARREGAGGSVVYSGAGLPVARSDLEHGPLLEAARASGRAVLSSPVRGEEGRTSLLAALPLQGEGELQTFLVLSFHAEALVEESLPEETRAHFAYDIFDGRSLVHRHRPAGRSGDLGRSAVVSARRFTVRNRSWSLVAAPVAGQDEASRWVSVTPVLLLGLLLSLGLAGLAYLSLRRARLFQSARDGALAEVAAREEAQRALVDSERRYRSVFDSATDGLVVMDPTGAIVEANEAACRMHDYRPGGLSGQSYVELIAADRRDLWDELHRQLDVTGTVRLESEHVTREGARVHVDVHGTAFAHGGAPRILVILTDVTSLRRSEQLHTALSRKVLLAQEEERARISRELHDELGQVLTAIRFELGWIGKRLSGEGRGDGGVLSTIETLVEKAASDLRVICRGLRPPLLDDLGLEPALRHLVEEFEERVGVSVDLEVGLADGEEALPAEVSLATYRVVQESLTYVGRHAAAKKVSIRLLQKPTVLVASVYDDGKGAGAGTSRGRHGGDPLRPASRDSGHPPRPPARK